MHMKNVPNLITCLRMLLSIALCFLLAHRVAFVVVYAVCGISDAVDGWLARRLGLATPLGAKLDSIADFLFFGVSLYAMLYLLRDTANVLVLILLCLVAAVRLLNLLITRRKFGQWGVLHTLGNKLAGLALFVAIPVFVYLGSYPLAVILPLFLIALLSAIDEALMLLTGNTYDPNARGFLFRKRSGEGTA